MRKKEEKERCEGREKLSEGITGLETYTGALTSSGEGEGVRVPSVPSVHGFLYVFNVEANARG